MNVIKALNVRMPKEMWVFLKKQSMNQERTMNEIILECLEKMKKKSEKELTYNDTTV